MLGKIGWLLIGLMMCCTSIARPTPPLWGKLAPGPHAVGFRTLAQTDVTRTWRVTRDYRGAFTPDAAGRPVVMNVWYPARAGTAKALTFGAYLDQQAPPEFSTIAALLQARNTQNVESAVSEGERPRLRYLPMFARKSPRAAEGRFALILYFGGLNSDINANAVMGEYLASHGYVFASISLLGPSSETTVQGREPDDIELAVRDMEFAFGILVRETNADPTRLIAMGHSVGAVDALVLAARNGNVRAAVALDGTYGFEGSSRVLSDAHGFAAVRLRAPVLDLRRPAGEQGAVLDPAAMQSLRHARRSIVILPHMHHSDFTGFAPLADEFSVPVDPRYAGSGWDRATARRGYENVCEIVRAFLDSQVLGLLDGTNRTHAAVEAQGGSLQELAALPAPLSPSEALALNAEKGPDEVRRWLRECAADAPGACVDAPRFNSTGYELLGQQRLLDARNLFELVVWAHPTSANAEDSLADALLVSGNRDLARAAIRRAIELAATDPSIDETQRARFIADEQRRLAE